MQNVQYYLKETEDVSNVALSRELDDTASKENTKMTKNCHYDKV